MSRSRKKNAEQGYIFSIFGQEAMERSIDIFFPLSRDPTIFLTRKKTTVVLIISIFFNSVRLPLKKKSPKKYVPNKIPPNETLSLYKRRLSEKKGEHRPNQTGKN